MRAEDSSLWNEPLEAQKLMRERQGLEDGIAGVKSLTQALEDNIGLIELGEEEGDQSVIAEAEAAIRSTQGERSEERRVGKECLSVCRSRWSPYH